MYDLIGDVHGHADELEALLLRMSYRETDGCYRHPERTAVFLGDLIDRGPSIRRVIEIVRPMVESGAALMVLGNHEFNAICFHTEDPRESGQYLRPHTAQNIKQHAKTLEAFSKPGEMAALIDWFYSIPLWIERPEFRAVHACWEPSAMARLQGAFPDLRLNRELLPECGHKDGRFYQDIETVLKGPEFVLPAGAVFLDKDGHERDAVRVRWFLPSAGETYRSYSIPLQELAPEVPVVGDGFPGYPGDAPPVFFGHYWLVDAEPVAMGGNCFCLDFSVAKGGFLCGYRVGEGFVR